VKPAYTRGQGDFFNGDALTLTNREWIVYGEKNFFLGIDFGMESARAALNEAGPKAAAGVCGVSVDTSGSSPAAVDEEGTPPALHEDFEEDYDE
jgi:ribulose kinase